VSDASDDNNETTSPPAGAFASSVTIPSAVFPPLIAVGLTLILLMAGAITVSGAETAVPFDVAVIVVTVEDATGTVEIVNVAVA
jgi:hypothetical protein